VNGGQEQTIEAFSQGEQPLDLILLFDISGSMRHQVQKVAEVHVVARHAYRLRERDQYGFANR